VVTEQGREAHFVYREPCPFGEGVTDAGRRKQTGSGGAVLGRRSQNGDLWFPARKRSGPAATGPCLTKLRLCPQKGRQEEKENLSERREEGRKTFPASMTDSELGRSNDAHPLARRYGPNPSAGTPKREPGAGRDRSKTAPGEVHSAKHS